MILDSRCRRESAVREARAPGHARAVRAAACAVMGVPYGPVRLGYDCRGEADGMTVDGQPTSWQMTANRDAVVPYLSRA